MSLDKLGVLCFEYETPRLVRIQNKKLGLIRRIIQTCVVVYVGVVALWLKKGYQEFSEVESSVTTKVKGVTMSQLYANSTARKDLYSRVWDEADYVVPPAENGAFFVATNVVITPNQTRGQCPEDEKDVEEAICQPDMNTADRTGGRSIGTGRTDNPGKLESAQKCAKGTVFSKSRGPTTGNCVPSARNGSKHYTCEVEAWCPVEIDDLPLGDNQALMESAANYTVLIKNSIAFPYIGPQYFRNNIVGNNSTPCYFVYDRATREDNKCQIFRLGDIVHLAGGNFSELSVLGPVISISIHWNCDLDQDFMKYCLPKYSFRILDSTGWNFREAKYHEENRRTLFKLYGMKFIVTVKGLGGKFSFKNTVLNIGNGLALLGISTIICDLLLMHLKERVDIQKKKYDYVVPDASRRESMNGTTEPTQMNNVHLTQSTVNTVLNQVRPEPSFMDNFGAVFS